MPGPRKLRLRKLPKGGALYYKTREELPDLESWEQMGEPLTYLRVYSNSNTAIIIWEECSRGGIMMQVGDRIARGRDMVTVDNVVAFGPFYQGECEIFKPYVLYA